MPEISRFLGIVIAIYYNDHNPPHFHARYNRYKGTVEIGTGVVRGHLPKRALSLVQEWRILHQDDLLANWDRARSNQPLQPIDPLE